MPEDPLFSVCIEVRNRETTIQQVLVAILNQEYRNFELVIFDNNSSDRSQQIIQEFIPRFTDIEVNIQKSDKTIPDIASWNVPLKHARGRFIAICEGDDYFTSNHLKTAEALLNNEGVGLYVAGSKLSVFSESKTLESATLAESLRLLKWCPPPSTFIFRRVSQSGNQFYFNEECIWAGEYSLLDEVLSEYPFVVENHSQNFVERGFRFYLKNSSHMRDMVSFKDSKTELYSLEEMEEVSKIIAQRAWHFFWLNLINRKIDQELIRIFLREARVSKPKYRALMMIFLKTFQNEISRKLKA